MIWNSDAVAEGLGVVSSAHAQTLFDLKTLLDSYHGVSRPTEYYDLVAGDWLMHFTHVAYAAYLDVIRGTPISPRQAPIFVFADHNDYRASVETPLLSEQLCQLITRMLNRSSCGDIQFMHQTRSVGIRQLGLGQRLKQGIKGCFSALGAEDASFVICRPYLKCSRSEWGATLWKWRKWARLDDFDYPIEVTVRVDTDWRRKHSAGVLVSNFSDMVRALLPLYVPVIYLEALADYRQKAHALNLLRPKALYTANSLHGHTLFKILAADWREEGTKLINHQHGGGYGIDRIHAIEEYETRVADRFYTLGWEGASPKQVPLAGALSSSQFHAAQENNRILLNCISFPKQAYRIHFHPMPGTIETMIAETVDFVGKMKYSPELLARPYSSDYGWGMVDAMRQVKPDLCLDDRRTPALKSYARSSLVVHNYLGTSWLETLAMNIPTVCFYDTNTYAFRDAAQPFIDDLAAVGILHQSGAEAARFIMNVKTDLKGGGKDPKCRRRVKHL